MQLTGKKKVEMGMDNIKLRMVPLYKEDENKIIEIVNYNLDWIARSIADL